MAQQILYATATGAILQWQDTAAFSYAAPPSGAATLAVTEAEWAGQGTAQHVSNGALVAGAAPAPVPTLAEAQAAQAQILSAACQAQIYGGFISSALGAAYSYPAQDKDQQNLTASVVASLMPGLPSTWETPFWCADSAGAWDMRPHTAAQIQQVGTDGKAAILAAIQKNSTLTGQVEAAMTVAAVQAVVW